jgi:cysteinyl-tRNA synthetase
MFGVGAQKMSKSLNNFVSVGDALQLASKNVWRLLFLQTHPRSPLDYNRAKLEQAQNSWNRLNNALREAPEAQPSDAVRAFQLQFETALSDDLNTPEALAAVFDAVSDFNRSGDKGLGFAARTALETLGFSFETAPVGDTLTPQLLDILIQVRNEARERRDFKASDSIRDQLAALGVVLEDGIEGTKWKIEA